MIKVVIADDEEKVCQLICNLVDWAEFDMQIVGTAHNGLDALELVEHLSPDLMVTDIRMPGCDGLELISRAKQLDDGLEFIIVSGYRHFEYAQTAIKYGVGDYLLKPIKRSELAATLTKMRERYRHRNEQLSKEEQLRLRLQNDIDRLRAGLFSDLLFGKPAGESAFDLAALNERYHYAFCPGCFMVLVVKVDGGQQMHTSGAFAVLQEKLAGILRAGLQPVCLELEICFRASRAWGVLNFTPENAPQVRRQLKAVLGELLVQKNIFPEQFTIGLGSVVQTPAGFPQSALDADRAANQRLLEGTGKLLSAVPEQPESAHGRELLADVSRAMENGLEILDPLPLQAAVQHMGDALLASEQVTGNEILHLAQEVCNTYVMLARRVHYELPDAETLTQGFAARADLCSSARAVWAELTETLRSSVETLIEHKKQEDSRPIRTAKQYIQEHAAEPLTLEEVGGVVGFNASYFSSLFKKETGQNFLEYLSEVRMNRAKELLKETKLPVGEICERVGYADLKYFTKSFKKATGIKPGEFRKLYS